MGSIEIDYGIQTRLDLYMPRQAGRVVRPDEVIHICGDIVSAQDQMKIWQARHPDISDQIWQARHSDTSDQMDLGNGMIGVKVYFSAKQDIDFDIMRKKRHGYLVREKRRQME